MELAGGEPTPLTHVKDGIHLFDLSGDSKSLYYSTTKKNIDDEWKDLREKYKDLNYGHGVTNFSKVWRLDLTTWRVEELLDDHRVVVSMKVSPDQRRIAMITTPDEELIYHEGWSRIDIFEPKTKKLYAVTMHVKSNHDFARHFGNDTITLAKFFDNILNMSFGVSY